MPDWKDEIRQRLASLKLPPTRENEIVEEMSQHLEERYHELLTGGTAEGEARSAALGELAENELLAVELRRVERGVPQEPIVPGARRTSLFADLWHDLRYGIRMMRKNPGFTGVAVLTFALGIGLVTIQFSLVNGALLKELPFERSERIMAVGRLGRNGRVQLTAPSEFREWREHQKSFGQLAAYAAETIEFSGDELYARSYRGAAFSAGVLELLQVRPLLGRGFTPEDEGVNAPLVVLISHGVWQNDFGAEPGIVGQALRVRGEPATIIGVLPEEFAFPQAEAVWVNLHSTTIPNLNLPGTRPAVEVLGRLNDDTTLTAARAEFELLIRPPTSSSDNVSAQPQRAHIVPFTEASKEADITIVLLSLLGVVGGVMALACLNVANLFSARALSRSRELAVRAALGASRGRLIRQMLCESTLLAVCGAMGGLLLAVWAVPLVNRGIGAEDNKPFWIVVDLDYRVLAAMAGLTLAVGVVAGLFPALRATRRDPGDLLKNLTGSISSARLGRFNRGLVVAQVGLSCAVLVATSAFVDHVRKRVQLDLPFDPDRTLVANIRLSVREYPDHNAQLAFQLPLLDRLRALPGVERATLSRFHPLWRSGGVAMEIMGDTPDSATELPEVYYNPVVPGFFHDLHIPLREGREFEETDGLQSERVAIVNERLVYRFWPGESALGKRIRLHSNNPALEEPWLKIVGVVAALPSERAPDRNGGAMLHVPLRQHPLRNAMVLLTARQDPTLLIQPLREVVRSLSLDVPVDGVQTVTENFERRRRTSKVMGGMTLSFGVSALFLAVVGVYGVTSFAVQRRTREFGLRVAVGAQQSDVLGLVFKQGARQLGLGLGLGAVLGWAGSGPLIGQMATNEDSPGAVVYLFVCAVIALAVGFALWLPARRAATVDPMMALRDE